MARATLLLALFALLTAAPAAGDEIRLKDGTVIRGTIVGFEDGAFKVETSYGFALVRRDRIASIVFAAKEEKKPPAPAKSPGPAKAPPPAKSAAAPSPQTPAAEAPKPAPLEASAPPAKQPPAPVEAAKQEPPAKSSPVSAAPARTGTSPPGPPAPAKTPEPVQMRDEVDGRAYINHTYGFRLYKPPRWEIFERAHHRLPNAIVAMGAGDETTLLVVSREPLSGSLAAHADRSERALRSSYGNYRALGEDRITLAGQPALVRRFRAVVDEHEWSGRVAWVARGGEVFVLFGMTQAETELVQLQENILTRAITSLEFTKP